VRESEREREREREKGRRNETIEGLVRSATEKRPCVLASRCATADVT